MNLAQWSPDKPLRVVDLRNSLQVAALFNDYSPSVSTPPPASAAFGKVVEHGIALGASTAVVEHRYLDPDWRSEHAAFYSKTFRRYPGVAHRLHFFAAVFDGPADDGGAYDPPFEDLGYLGYSVLRPLPVAPVGRTVLPPLDADRDSLKCWMIDEITLFGHTLRITGAPFISGDGQLGGCGHATVWTTAYYHHKETLLPRQLPASIASWAAQGVALGRPPQPGALTVYQLHAAFAGTGLDPLYYDLETLDPAEDRHALICRYLDSGLPVTVASGNHTYVLIGYRDRAEGAPEYFAQDDECGPYEYRDLPEPHPETNTSVYVVIPLPSKVFLPGEYASAIAEQFLSEEANKGRTEQAKDLFRTLLKGEHSFRTLLLPSNVFKARAARRYPADLAAALRYHPMPRWLWVVQAVVDGGVVAEALVDATQRQDDPHLLAWWLPGEASLWLPDEDDYDVVPLASFGPLPLLVPGLPDSPAGAPPGLAGGG